jgi:hypothetical protein
MKKLVLSLVLGASLAVAPSVFALSSMTADNMKSATGQAGVSIAIDNVVIESFTGSTSYIDDDEGAVIVITDRHVLKQYLAMTSDADYQADFMAKTGVTAVLGTWVEAHALTIDIGTCAVLSAGLSDNMGTPLTVAGVVIGLPTLLITTGADSYSVKATMTGAANDGGTYISISKAASSMAILGGTVEIAPH